MQGELGISYYLVLVLHISWPDESGSGGLIDILTLVVSHSQWYVFTSLNSVSVSALGTP